MKQFRYKEWLFVEVPEDAITFNIEEDFDYLDYEQVMNGVGLYRRNAINKSSILSYRHPAILNHRQSR